LYEQVSSKGKDCVLVQRAEDFAKVAAQLMKARSVFYLSQKMINSFVDLNPWHDVCKIIGILKCRVILVTGQAVKCWENRTFDVPCTEILLPTPSATKIKNS